MINKDKKGQSLIPVHTIMSLIIVGVVLLLVGGVLSKLLKVESSAEDSFEDFATYIEQMSEMSSGESMSLNLILDSETVVVYFDENDPVYFRAVSYYEIFESSIVLHSFFERPEQCEDDLGCLCLFKSVNEKRNDFTNVEKNEHFTVFDEVSVFSGVDTICKTVDYRLSIDTCSIGQLGEDNSLKMTYGCEGGFVIDKGLYEDDDAHRRFFLQKNRREHFVLRSSDDFKVLIEPTNTHIYEPEEGDKEGYEWVLENKRVEYVPEQEGADTAS